MKASKSLKEVKIGFVGAHTKSLKADLEKRGYQIKLLPISHFPNIREIKELDIIYGSFFQSSWPWFFVSKLRRKKTMCHWIGSDSLLANKNFIRKLQRKIFTRFIDINVAVSDRIKDELSEMGIESTVLFHGSDIEPEEVPMPSKFAALVYFMEGSETLYGINRIVEISKEFLDIDFYFIGYFNPENFKELEKQQNLHFLGFIDMNEIWPKINVILRMTVHDGFPKVILEAYAKGKYVIHSFPLPGVIHCETNEDVIEELKKLQKIKEVNKEGIKLFEEQLHFDRFVEKFEEICVKLLSS